MTGPLGQLGPLGQNNVKASVLSNLEQSLMQISQTFLNLLNAKQMTNHHLYNQVQKCTGTAATYCSITGIDRHYCSVKL